MRDLDHAFQPMAAWPEEMRPRERLLREGAPALNDAELLAVLLRTGRHRQTAVELAYQVLNQTHGLAGAAELHPREWREVRGIGPSKAATIAAALELGRRTWTRRNWREPLGTPAAAYRHVAPHFLGEKREAIWIVGLDPKNLPVVESKASAGTADRAPVHPREVFGPLIRAGAVKGILAHNHPSGDPEPSKADVKLTRGLIRAGELLQIPLVDHLVVAGERYVSMRDRRLCTFAE